jgi:hypothetical protein
MAQTVDHHDHSHLVLLRSIEYVGRLGQRDGLDAKGRLLGMNRMETRRQTGTGQQLQSTHHP